MTEPLKLDSAGHMLPSSVSSGRDSLLVSRTSSLLADTFMPTDLFDGHACAYDGKKLLAWGQNLHDPQLIDLLNAAGGDLRTPITADGITLLHWAVLHGKEEMVNLLLAQGLEVDVATQDGRTPLHFAALSGQVSIFDKLLTLGADPSRATNDGITPLLFAARGRAHAVIERLLQFGINLNASDQRGMTALHIAARDGMWSAIEVLIRHGADINLPDAQGRTPLWHAMQNGHGPVVDLLLAHGADEDAVLEPRKLVDAENARRFPAWIDNFGTPSAHSSKSSPSLGTFVMVITGIMLVAAYIHGCR